MFDKGIIPSVKGIHDYYRYLNQMSPLKFSEEYINEVHDAYKNDTQSVVSITAQDFISTIFDNDLTHSLENGVTFQELNFMLARVCHWGSPEFITTNRQNFEQLRDSIYEFADEFRLIVPTGNDMSYAVHEVFRTMNSSCFYIKRILATID